MNCKGHFLVASPHLTDKNFYRSVVLMIQHDEEGAFGVVLNRPTQNTIADLWSLIAETPCPKQQPIHLGGPVSGPLIAIHSEAAQSEMEVTEGVYFSTAKEAIIEVVTHASGPFRLFVGYAGWSGGQLDGELEAGGWLTTPATRVDVFSDQDDLWNRVSRRIGLDILAPSIKRMEIPDDPSWN